LKYYRTAFSEQWICSICSKSERSTYGWAPISRRW